MNEGTFIARLLAWLEEQKTAGARYAMEHPQREHFEHGVQIGVYNAMEQVRVHIEEELRKHED